ncbi:hypothetical protein [Aromatoleum evansii]|uniref:hypothetical protein n=1 Tax=Aromatoleum evansii TaxID=59406 RepID=UPI00145FAA54|nr:hypothetical protein [Aromatoleum evansii]NMG29127.1 hypothetical protein [Aromatoleum evansii]
MRILTLFARNGTEKYRDVDARIRRQLQEDLAGVDREFVIVDTAMGPDVMEVRGDGVVILGASNDHWEFGAWGRGVEYCRHRLMEFDYIHFVTSAFYFGYVDFHRFVSQEMLELYRGRAVALGHIEVYNEPVAFRSIRFQSWLRSSYMFIPPAEVVMLGDLTTVKGGEGVFSGDPTVPFVSGGDVSPSYAHNLTSWLTGEGTGQGVEWHSRFVLDVASLPFFKAKAKAIINEMSLSNRLKAQGCALVDMTWLHRKIAGGSVPSDVPSWHTQLVERGTGHESIVEGAR